MVRQIVYKYSSILIIAGAILLTVGYWLRPYIEKQFVHDFAGSTALWSSIFVGLGALLLITGLPALADYQRKQIGTPGMLAAALSFAGLNAFHLGTLSLYFVLPILVTNSSATLELVAQDQPPFPRFAIFWAMALLVQNVGVLWLSWKTWKAQIYPKIAALLMGIGAFGMFIAPVIQFRLLQPFCTIMMLGFILCGLYLFRQSKLPRLKKVKSVKPLT